MKAAGTAWEGLSGMHTVIRETETWQQMTHDALTALDLPPESKQTEINNPTQCKTLC